MKVCESISSKHILTRHAFVVDVSARSVCEMWISFAILLLGQEPCRCVRNSRLLNKKMIDKKARVQQILSVAEAQALMC
jgi:hypothetical protein